MAKTKREKGELRKVAAEARERLKSGYWTDIKKEKESAKTDAAAEGKSPAAVDDYYRARISREVTASKNSAATADEELYKKVCAILSEDEDVSDPIGRLIDEEKYNGMDAVTKQRYVMALAAKYRELSLRYYDEKNLKNS